MDVITKTVDTKYNGIRIDSFLRAECGFSTALIRKVKYSGVALNGAVVTMRAVVHAGDTVSVTLPIRASENVRPIDLPLDIVYEDDYILAVNKPSDMPTHPSRGNHIPTLAECVASYMKTPFVFRAINRLDRDTSGIIVIAKDSLTATLLSREMMGRQIVKKYTALVVGIPENDHGFIDAPIEREEEGSIKRVVRADGKNALTEYRIISHKDGIGAVCEITLHTGRTHQIRVHMAHIGHPLYADFLYGSEIEGEVYRLHAGYISFTHPFTGERLTLTSSAPF